MRAFIALCVSSVSLTILGVGGCVGDEPSGLRADGAMDAGPPEAAPPDGSAASDGSQDPSVDAGTDGRQDGAACTAPLADCDDDGACETSTATDPKHCGACGHDCGGGSCFEGRCQPQTIAANVDAPLSIAVNSSGVFWLRKDVVEKCPKSGCVGDPTRLSTLSTQSDALARRHLFVNETKVYWLGDPPGSPIDYYLYQCEVAGCAMSPTPSADYTGPGQLVGNSTSLIWYDSTGSLKLVPLDGGSPQFLTLVYMESSFGFAADDDWLVFSNTATGATGAGGVWIGKVENAPPTKLMDKGLHVAIAAGKTVLASVDINQTQSTVLACPVTGCGGSGTPLFSGAEGTINDIVADGTAVYWAVKASPGAADGKIRTCRLPDCPGGPQTVADDQANPFALALDAEFVYWANRGTGAANTGSIARVRRH